MKNTKDTKFHLVDTFDLAKGESEFQFEECTTSEAVIWAWLTSRGELPEDYRDRPELVEKYRSQLTLSESSVAMEDFGAVFAVKPYPLPKGHHSLES